MPIVTRFLSALAGTAVDRMRRGPLRPSWSFMFEASIAFLRRTGRLASGRPPLEQRAVWEALRPPPDPVMKRVRRTPVDAGGIPAEWFEPIDGHGDAVVLFLHGGSFIYGSIASHAEMIARIALAAGARVLALSYRLVPEAVFPAPIDDTLTAYRWLLGQGVAPGRIVLAGDSAGGNLSLAALLAMRDRGEPLPAGSVPICPWVDPPRTGGSLDENQRFDWGFADDFAKWCAFYAGDADPAQPLISPIRADLSGLPPLCILWGECEMLRDQVTELVTRAREAGLDVTAQEHPDMVHNWLTLHALTPEAERAFTTIGSFVKRVTAG
ncbi:6-hexanolactone hydrolase [Minicystis rosea]|nr:6-hexanolactone hydrolase [Minicystis rosea]